MSQAQILDYAKTCLLIVLRLSLIPILVIFAALGFVGEERRLS